MNNEMNLKSWLESYAYERQREIVRKRSNAFPMKIDYSVFKKTKEEKLALLRMKVKLPKTRTHKFEVVLHEQF